MNMIAAPHITKVGSASVAFREHLDKGIEILKSIGEIWGVYSRHYHFLIPAGKVVFEALTADGKLDLSLMTEAEAAKLGRPSCWGFTPEGAIVVLRYADISLHKRCGIDATSESFQAELAQIAQAFVAAGLHRTLEVNIAGQLFPPGEGGVTLETTDEANCRQTVEIVPLTDEMTEVIAACWVPGANGQPVTTGYCAGGWENSPHSDPDDVWGDVDDDSDDDTGK
ncbi:MAG TPA: hypothetical protein VFZ58_04865 [Candidatus Saccharimonadales bacterium]